NPQSKFQTVESYLKFKEQNAPEATQVILRGKSETLTASNLAISQLVVSNAFTAEGLVNDVVAIDNPVELALTLNNLTGKRVNSDNLDINFYMDGALIGSAQLGELVPGTNTKSYTINLPADTVAGTYSIIATIDEDKDVMGSSKTVASGDYLMYTGSVLVLDSTDDNIDRLTDFGNTALGINSASEFITLANASDQTIVVSLDLLADNFSFSYEKPEVYPVGYSDLDSLTVLQFNKEYTLDPKDASWIKFSVPRASTITALGAAGTNDLRGLTVYNQYGDTILDLSGAMFWDASFNVPAAGTYYIHFEDIRDKVDFTLGATPLLSVSTDVSEGAGFTHDISSDAYTVTLAEPGRYSVTMQPEMADRLQRYFEFYHVDINNYVDLLNSLDENIYDMGDWEVDLPGSTDSVFRFAPDTTFRVYNSAGVEVFSDVYEFTELYRDYISYYMFDLSSKADVTDPDAPEFFIKQFDLNLLEADTYTFTYTYDDGYDQLIADPDDPYNYGQYDYRASDVVTSFVYAGSPYVLEPGESLDVPLTFTPDFYGDYTGKLLISSSGQSEVITVDIAGRGVSGDLAIEDSEIVADFPTNIQSGSSLRIATSISNAGLGMVNAGASLNFYLVSEGVSTPVMLADGSASFDLISYLDGEYDRQSLMNTDELLFTVDLDIPSTVADGVYDIRVELVQNDPELVQDALTDVAVFEDIAITPAQALLIDSESDLVVADGMGDTTVNYIGFYLDSINNAGGIPLNDVKVGFVDIFNRSAEPMSLTSITLPLNTADGYYISLDESSTSWPVGDVVIAAGQYQRVFVKFNPQQFNEGSAPGDEYRIDGKLRIETSDEFVYNIDLHGEIAGGDLVVTEGANISDGIIAMPNSRLNLAEPTSKVVLTLKNQGKDPLIIRGIDFAVNSPFYTEETITALTLESGETYDVTVCFNPESVGHYSEKLYIRSNDPADNFRYAMTITGAGINPLVKALENNGVVNDYSLAFGNQAGQRASDTSELVVLANGERDVNGKLIPGAADSFVIESMAFGRYELVDGVQTFIPVDGFEALIVTPDGLLSESAYRQMQGGSIVIAPGTSLDLNVDMIAEAVGDYSGILRIGSQADGYVEVMVGGTVSLPQYSLSDNTGKEITDNAISLGDKAVANNLSADELKEVRTFTFTLDGKATMRVDNISVAGAGYYLIDSNGAVDADGLVDIDRVLNPGDKVYITVMYSAGDADAGVHNGVLTLEGSEKVNYSITTTVVEPDIDLDSSVVMFNDTLIGQRSIQYVTVKNTGTADLSITGFVCADEQFSLVENNVVITAGSEKEVGIYYEPNTHDSPVSDFVLLTNDRDEASVTVTVMGNSGGNLLTPSKVSGNNYYYVFNNPDGDRVRLTIKYTTDIVAGAKAAVATAPQVYLDSSSDRGNISCIKMADSNMASSIVISGNVSVGDIYAGSLATIKATAADLTGNVNIAGSLSSIRMDDIEAGSKITVLDTKSAGKSVSIKVDSIAENAEFNLASMNIKTFQATDYTSGKISAQNIGSLVIKNGDLGASVTSYDDIRSINVKKDITANISVYDSIGTIKTGGNIDEVMIMAGREDLAHSAKSAMATGSIKSVQVGGDINGDIYALNGEIGKILASRGNINGGVYADSLKSISARNMTGALMAIDNSVGKFQVKYDIVDTVIGVGYNFSSLANTGYNAGDVASIVNNSVASGKAVNSYKIGGEVSDSSLLSFLR
ncbi:MAG: choice-of-anchor D domain-containing protein, partial [Sedimentisphaerales bacterium]|nr:choice-of-anchor D domain-containing protein [Sedimentisphaerales bacterium]